jgi:uncharacterized membrane protein YkvA (DUF1232 family)
MQIKEPSGFKAAKKKAETLVRDVSRLATLLENAVAKADRNKSILGKILDDLSALFRLIRFWISGRYRDVPWQTIVLATAAVIYFVNPFDLIPDPIPFLGFVDDSSVIGFVLYSISGDLKRFLEWESKIKNDTKSEIQGNLHSNM